MNQPFEELTGNPIWAEFRRQADSDPDWINLTDLWRASGRQRGWSPRQYARMYHSRIKRLDCQGAKPDDPAYADEATAYHYIQLLDPEIMDVCGKVFFAAIRENPAGMLLSACSHSDGAGSVAGLFISAANTVDGDCIEGNRRILRAAVEMTRDLDIFSQETAIAQAQRALSGVREIRAERMVDGEMEFDNGVRQMNQPRSIFRSRRKRGPAAYLPKAIEAGLKMTPSTISLDEVLHAAACPFPRGTGPCTCDPTDNFLRRGVHIGSAHQKAGTDRSGLFPGFDPPGRSCSTWCGAFVSVEK